MPKITISEVDYSTTLSNALEDVVVYIPGFPGRTATGEDITTFAAGTPVLFKTLTAFVNAVGTQPKNFAASASDPAVYDKGYMMAYQALSAGLYVLYEWPTSALEAGVTTSAEMTAALAVASLWTKLQDKSLYNIRFLTTGGYCTEWATDATPIPSEGLAAVAAVIPAIKYMIHTAAVRNDCIALVDYNQNILLADHIFAAYNSGLTLQTTELSSYTSADLKYAAAFTPWSTYDVPGNSTAYTYLPPSIAYLIAYATATESNPSWFAVAGATRGKVTATPVTDYGDAAAAVFQNRLVDDICINPICNVSPYGNLIWGNRTLHIIDNTNLTASDFLNIRQTVCDIAKTVYVASRSLTFEQNSDVLWINFKSKITPLLDQMVSGNGITSYQIIKETTTKKATLKARIKITPIEAVEDFDITIELDNSIVTVA